MSELKTLALTKDALLVRGVLQAESIITENSPALSVMTDFRVVDVITVNDNTKLQEAHSLMIKRAIRLLFVLKNDELVGIITVRDILGERPLLLQKHYNEITVGEIVTKKEELRCLSYSTLEQSNVGQLLIAIKKINRRHILIVDNTKEKEKIVGMISTSTVAQKMGKTLNTGLPTDLFK